MSLPLCQRIGFKPSFSLLSFWLPSNVSHSIDALALAKLSSKWIVHYSSARWLNTLLTKGSKISHNLFILNFYWVATSICLINEGYDRHFVVTEVIPWGSHCSIWVQNVILVLQIGNLPSMIGRYVGAKWIKSVYERSVEAEDQQAVVYGKDYQMQLATWWLKHIYLMVTTSMTYLRDFAYRSAQSMSHSIHRPSCWDALCISQIRIYCFYILLSTIYRLWALRHVFMEKGCWWWGVGDRSGSDYLLFHGCGIYVLNLQHSMKICQYSVMMYATDRSTHSSLA